MPVQTKAQQDLILAERLISAIPNDNTHQEVRKIYGGLCHSFPILVRTCGLCQALAFSKDKATVSEGGSKPRHQAHQLLLDHVAQVLGSPGQDVLALIAKESAADYMLHTRRLLSAWIYFKRFAVSILKVENAKDEENRGND